MMSSQSRADDIFQFIHINHKADVPHIFKIIWLQNRRGLRINGSTVQGQRSGYQRNSQLRDPMIKGLGSKSPHITETETTCSVTSDATPAAHSAHCCSLSKVLSVFPFQDCFGHMGRGSHLDSSHSRDPSADPPIAVLVQILWPPVDFKVLLATFCFDNGAGLVTWGGHLQLQITWQVLWAPRQDGLQSPRHPRDQNTAWLSYSAWNLFNNSSTDRWDSSFTPFTSFTPL